MSEEFTASVVGGTEVVVVMLVVVVDDSAVAVVTLAAWIPVGLVAPASGVVSVVEAPMVAGTGVVETGCSAALVGALVECSPALALLASPPLTSGREAPAVNAPGGGADAIAS